MILYRVVSEAELAAYLKGQNIKPGKDCVPNNNSWKRPKVCFFGTANNCAHWQPICAGHVIVKLDVRGTYMKIKKRLGNLSGLRRAGTTGMDRRFDDGHTGGHA